MKLLFLVNNANFFLSHRLPIGVAARKAGFEVHVATPAGGRTSALADHGFIFHPIPMARSAARFWEELGTLASIYRLYRDLRPDVVHHVTIKPVLYGTLAARITRVTKVVNAISGLGYVFIQQGTRAAFKRSLVRLAYRISLRHPNQKIIFQNPDDLLLFQEGRMVSQRDTVIIKGSGVDTEIYRPMPEPEGIPLALLPSRMLWDKGIREFVEAARILKMRQVKIRCVLVGGIDPGNPASIPEQWIKEREKEGILEWMGHNERMEQVLAKANLVCLPSYREGLPKALIEAASCGRAIVTTDVPGCREIVRHGRNGLLVPPRDPVSLAEAVASLAANPRLRKEMGSEGRRMVLEEFSEARVVQQTLELYQTHPA